jgi:hypothetical protein
MCDEKTAQLHGESTRSDSYGLRQPDRDTRQDAYPFDVDGSTTLLTPGTMGCASANEELKATCCSLQTVNPAVGILGTFLSAAEGEKALDHGGRQNCPEPAGVGIGVEYLLPALRANR